MNSFVDEACYRKEGVHFML